MRSSVERASRSLAVAGLLAVSAAGAQAQDKSGYSLFRPTPDEHLRDMATDRPDKTESPITVDAGRLQVEMDLMAYTRDASGGETVRTRDIAPFNVKVGLTSTTELQVVFGAVSRVSVDNGATKTNDSGTDDVVLRVKHNLWGNDGGATALAVMPFVKIPVGTRADLNDDVEGGLIVPYARDLGGGFGLGMMGEVDIGRRDTGSGYGATVVGSAALGFDATDRLGLFAEIYAERSLWDGAETAVTVGGGATYAVTDHLQLDGAINVGVSQAADDLNLLAGVTQRF